MYFNKDNNFFHGIMFHHFHDDGIHTKGQGSLDKEDFYKMINFIEDGAVFRDNALGASGIDAGDYVLPENDVVIPSKDKSDKDEDIVPDLREPETENLLTNQVLSSEMRASENASSEIVSDGSEISEVTLEHEPVLKPPMSITRPSRMSFVKPGNNS